MQALCSCGGGRSCCRHLLAADNFLMLAFFVCVIHGGGLVSPILRRLGRGRVDGGGGRAGHEWLWANAIDVCFRAGPGQRRFKCEWVNFCSED